MLMFGTYTMHLYSYFILLPENLTTLKMYHVGTHPIKNLTHLP